MDAQNLVIIDKFGVNLGFSREYGRASPGQRAVGHRPCNTGGNVTVVAGLSRHGIIAPLIFPGASNGEIFKNYVEKVLAPELAPGDTALMDNLSAHKGQGIEDIFKASRITLKFLPPYSPDLSPMEQAISKIKGELRKMAARSYELLVDAVKQALDDSSTKNALGYFKGCGYCIETE